MEIADSDCAASVEIAAGNAELAERTTAQAASIHATVRSMAELTGTVRENADRALAANEPAGAAMEQVVGSVRQVSALIAGIGNASREQAGGIAAIGEAINAMDASTRDNARLVEQP